MKKDVSTILLQNLFMMSHNPIINHCWEAKEVWVEVVFTWTCQTKYNFTNQLIVLQAADEVRNVEYKIKPQLHMHSVLADSMILQHFILSETAHLKFINTEELKGGVRRRYLLKHACSCIYNCILLKCIELIPD